VLNVTDDAPGDRVLVALQKSRTASASACASAKSALRPAASESSMIDCTLSQSGFFSSSTRAANPAESVFSRVCASVTAFAEAPSSSE